LQTTYAPEIQCAGECSQSAVRKIRTRPIRATTAFVSPQVCACSVLGLMSQNAKEQEPEGSTHAVRVLFRCAAVIRFMLAINISFQGSSNARDACICAEREFEL